MSFRNRIDIDTIHHTNREPDEGEEKGQKIALHMQMWFNSLVRCLQFGWPEGSPSVLE